MTDRSAPADSPLRWRNAGLVAVITGASRGLGAGIAGAWSTRGVDLGLCARTRPEPPPTSSPSGGPHGSRVVTASVDVTDADAVEEFARTVIARFGRIDLWVNNAGVLAPVGPLADAEPSALRAHVDVNLLGVAAGSASFARHVRSRAGQGVLVNLSSGAATRPYEGWGPYCRVEGRRRDDDRRHRSGGAISRAEGLRPRARCCRHRHASPRPVDAAGAVPRCGPVPPGACRWKLQLG